MQFRVLGPVEVHTSDGRVLRMPRRQERCMLAVLLLAAGATVAVDRLCELLWDGDPPQQARAAVRSHAARIRAMLARAGGPEVALVSRHGGYLLAVDPDTVDVHRFRRLLGQATSAADLVEQDRLLREALALWHGPALRDAVGGWARPRLCADLDELRLQATEQAMAVGLDLGRHQELLPELARLGAEEPLRERLAELHMLALYRAGRSGEALDVYTGIRQRLAERLGVDPASTLQQLQLAILRGEPLPAQRSPVPSGPPAVTPAQLPADLVGFTGRVEHLNRLDTLSGDATGVVIAGTAGVGKTALAVHWAHLVADRFPDGQLYVNLRGFDPTGSVLTPAEATRSFLDALDVSSQRIPADLDAQTGLYRSLLAGRKMLILLDNARDGDHVRPLLPGAPDCLVLVTSRNQLTALAATDGAHLIALDLLTPDEAGQMLAARLGADRVHAEPHAVEEIITRCARLPLALAIVAARAAAHPRFRLAALAEQLQTAPGGLDALHGGDAATDVRAVFSWSYHTLTPPAARLFRLLGLHPGPDTSTAAAASLAGIAPDAVWAVLAELARASLLVEHLPGRYTCHDLLRTYAADLARHTESAAQRHAATHRLLDHYLHTAHAAARLLAPTWEPMTLTEPQPGVTPENPTDPGEAMAWFTTEHPVLLAAAHHAATGWDIHAWQLARALAPFLDRQGHWHDWATTQRAAVAAAGRSGDPTAQAKAHRALAQAYTRLDRLDDAHTHLRHALDLTAEAGNRTEQALTHSTLAIVCEQQSRYTDALEHARRALDLFQAAGSQGGQADTLNSVGWYHALLGDHEQALDACQQALTLLQKLDDRYGQAGTWDSLGYAHHHLGHHTQAITCYQHSLDLVRDLGDRYCEATTLTHLGDTHHATGDPDAARHAWQQALTILDDLNHPDATPVRRRLTTHPAGQPA